MVFQFVFDLMQFIYVIQMRDKHRTGNLACHIGKSPTHMMIYIHILQRLIRYFRLEANVFQMLLQTTGDLLYHPGLIVRLED